MSKLPKTGDMFVCDGHILEAQESVCTCAGCFLMNKDQRVCTRKKRAEILPSCSDLFNDKDIIYIYIREATDDEIRKGAVDV